MRDKIADLFQKLVDKLRPNVIYIKANGTQDMYRKYNTDSGYDVRAPRDGVVSVNDVDTISLDMSVSIPKGFEFQLRPRSGLAKRKIIAQFGTIDNGYSGNIGITIINFGLRPFIYKAGERIGQLVLCPVNTTSKLIFTDEDLPVTERGAGGFGHTDGVERFDRELDKLKDSKQSTKEST